MQNTKQPQIPGSEDTREALFEIQVDAFMEGVADLPSSKEYGLT